MHYLEIEPEDLEKLYIGFNIHTPAGLQELVWFHILVLSISLQTRKYPYHEQKHFRAFQRCFWTKINLSNQRRFCFVQLELV